MIVDISRIIIKSDLQPNDLALEDATCMELEEKLYDRLHAEVSAQVSFIQTHFIIIIRVYNYSNLFNPLPSLNLGITEKQCLVCKD